MGKGSKCWVGREALDAVRRVEDSRARGCERGVLSGRKEVKRLLRRDREMYWRQVAEELEGAAERGDVRGLFAGVGKLKEGKRGGASVVVGGGGRIVRGDAAMEVWKSRFAGVVGVGSDGKGAGKLPAALPYVADDGPPGYEEVRVALGKMRGSGAPGVDGLTAGLMRAGGARVVWWLVRMFAWVWEKGEIPDEWRAGVVVPVFKKGDPRKVENYRGITLMVVAAKVLEKVILRRVRMDREKRCRETQAGFRAGRSCGEQVFVVRRLLEERAEWGLPVVAVALDFASAYDTVDREALFAVLEAEGMGRATLAVVRALHTGTVATVRLGGKESGEFSVERGVRQGSVLSPILFVALMDWVLREALDGLGTEVSVGGGCGLADLDYADDVLLLTTSLQAAQRGVDAVAEVGKRVGLELNPNKTVWMARGVDDGVLMVAGRPVDSSPSLVYLGVDVGPDGGMAGELSRHLTAANRSFWGLRRLWRDRGVSVATKARVYSAVVRGTLLYGAESWVLRREDERRVAVFDRSRLRWIAGIWRRDEVSNTGLLARVGLEGVENVIVRTTWRWLGHVLRMSEVRWPRRVLLWS